MRALRADITTLGVDAVVNAANAHLQHGGGVALAISRAGGPAIQEESDRWVRNHGLLESGRAAVTTAGDMPARFVIHVAGPIHRDDQDNEGPLQAAVRAALDAAKGASCRSVALPAISAGIYGYPMDEATAVIANECRAWVAQNPAALGEILLVGYDADTAAAFGAAL
jgi:putative ATPase